MKSGEVVGSKSLGSKRYPKKDTKDNELKQSQSLADGHESGGIDSVCQPLELLVGSMELRERAKRGSEGRENR